MRLGEKSTLLSRNPINSKSKAGKCTGQHEKTELKVCLRANEFFNMQAHTYAKFARQSIEVVIIGQ